LADVRFITSTFYPKLSSTAPQTWCRSVLTRNTPVTYAPGDGGAIEPRTQVHRAGDHYWLYRSCPMQTVGDA